LNKISIKLLGLVVFVGVLCFGTSGLVNVLAAVALPAGGDDFDAAETIEAGSYVTDHEIEQDSFEYFRISVEAGQGLEVKVTTPAGGSPYAGVVVYNSEEEEIGSEVIIGDSNASKTVSWVRGYEDSGTFYIAVGNEYDTNATGTKYEVSLDDYYDSDTQTDVGGTFETAYEIDSLGTYQGYITTEYGGTDEADFYKIRVAKGTTLAASVTPPNDVSVGVSIYTSDREEVAELLGAGDLYIKVHADYESTEDPISYTLKISSTGGTTTDGDTSTDGDGGENGGETTTDGVAGEGPNLILIGAGVAILALAGVLAFVFLRKKKGSTPSTGSGSTSAPPQSPKATPQPPQKEGAPPAGGAES
jgi:hypothetical protein